ncbi:GMC family oxidoreductase N-terminal domain-containing protein [Sphingobium sp. DEHP117]|uniref:GMC family oxidoreductase n=1 Tax=Sphingobium sp. DEHP117 TaxID=2993436 RepID=UPI0027D5253A|nr:GMC family oxidoreductase N-terminal domain-containing protein [Sphingobium sp. DEHP117]MDQ4421573.1 GMC family oxidoreductase N-terminal domain-containing protein [Sphingobium sp. DEHP117]
MAERFDYVIVGGGTAAGIVAYRLGEAGHSVCVLEAGPSDRHPYIHIPAGFSKTLFHPTLTWQFKTDPDPATGNRSAPYSQGRTLGGSSSINGMIYNRGQPQDFDSWAQMGNRGWSFDEVLPYFRKTEHRIAPTVAPDPQYRGSGGRLTVTNAPWPNELETAFIESAVNAGHLRNDDYNGATQEGVGQYQSAIRNGRRVSTATAFLHPASRQFDVKIMTGATVNRIVVENGRATGVRYRRGETEYAVQAGREVILCAGAVNSPRLLQSSGIGPGKVLQEAGVPVSHELPGVGENFRDHYSPRIVARAKKGVNSINLHVTGVPLLKQLALWLLGRPSVLATSPARIHLFGKSDPAMSHPDYAMMFAPASFKAGLVGVLDDFPGMTCGVWQQRPESTGYVRITGPSFDSVPRVNPRWLSAQRDQQVVLAALRAARNIYATDPLASLIDDEIFPGRGCETDEELLQFAREKGATSYHLVGTCKMGPKGDTMAVVDPELRVHGLEALRVIDSSIMPTIVSANTAATTMMIAEKGSDLILERNTTGPHGAAP